MKKLFYFTFFTINLFAQNPQVYKSLGDTIYNNTKNIQNLKNIDEYVDFKFKIDGYLLDVSNTKKLGYDIESGINTNKKSIYLKKLRDLSKENKYFLKSANKRFDLSIKTKNSSLFSSLVNSGMIDIHKNHITRDVTTPHHNNVN